MLRNTAACLAVLVVTSRVHASPSRVEDHSRLTSEVNRLIGRLRSPQLKEEAGKQADRLFSAESSQAIDAVDFFWDLRARGVLAASLADGSPDSFNMRIKTRAAEALLDLSEPGDAALARVAADALEWSNVGMSGGLEVQLAQSKFHYALAELLRHLTASEDLPALTRQQWSPDLVALIIKRARNWIDTGSAGGTGR
jgi:hypothetical protein